MQKYQERVVKEKSELDEKLRNLLSFITAEGDSIFDKLNLDEKTRLTMQARIMREYSDILDKRIKAFK